MFTILKCDLKLQDVCIFYRLQITIIRIFFILDFGLEEEPEAKPSSSENVEKESTKEQDLVQKPFAEPRNEDKEAIAQTGLGFTEAPVEVYTPGTLSIVEIHPTSTPG